MRASVTRPAGPAARGGSLWARLTASGTIRDGAMIAAAQAATMASRIVFIRVLTTVLSPGVYGELALLLGAAVLGSTVLCAPFLHANQRFLPDARAVGHLRAFRRELLRLLGGAWTLLVVSGVAAAMLMDRRRGSAMGSEVALLLAAMVAADVLRTFELGTLNVETRNRAYAVLTALDALVRPAVTLALILWTDTRIALVVGAHAVGSVVSYLMVRSRMSLPSTDAVPPAAAWRRTTRALVLRFALPMLPLGFLSWATSLADRYVLAAAAGTAETGIYAAAFGLGSQIALAIGIVLAANMRPRMFNANGARDADAVRRLFRQWLAAAVGGGVLVTLAVLILRHLITGLVLGHTFQAAAGLLPWITGAYAIQNVQQAFEARLYLAGRTGRLLAVQLVAGGVGLTAYLLLIPRWGAIGGCIGTLASMLAALATVVLLTMGLPWLAPGAQPPAAGTP